MAHGTALVPQVPATAGITPAYQLADATGMSLAPAAGRFVHVKNGSAASITVTARIPALIDGQTVANKVVTIAAGAEGDIGPFPNAYVQSDGLVWLDFSAVATVTVAAYAPLG